ncbi:MAG: hypothetical protein ACLR5I_12580 [Odoribacter splanchnicus]
MFFRNSGRKVITADR